MSIEPGDNVKVEFKDAEDVILQALRPFPPGMLRATYGASPAATVPTGGTCGGRRTDGQFVLVNEAVNLGIAIYNMRQGEGIRYETLFRDETVGALDATNAKEYVRMLRRAMDLGGFHQVVFICHTPLVWN
jgi:hypothetical protein